MKAVINSEYGGPEVLHVKEMPLPEPQADEIRIRVKAAVVGPSDVAFRKADPFIIRLMYGLLRPTLQIPGVEFAGVVDAVGSEVTCFEVGQEVFGMSAHRFGAHAEYVCVKADKEVALKPVNSSFAEALGICDGALTAITFLKEKAKLKVGQKILINGASGAVGAYAVQVAKFLGAEVTGVCSERNLELVQSIGADHVIDYNRQDFTKMNHRFDVVFDAVGKNSFTKCKSILHPNGVYLTTVPSLTIMLQMMWTSIFGGKRAIFTAAGLQQSKETLHQLTLWIEQGHLKPIIDKIYSLEQIAEAHHYVEMGRKKGNVIILMEKNEQS